MRTGITNRLKKGYYNNKKTLLLRGRYQKNTGIDDCNRSQIKTKDMEKLRLIRNIGTIYKTTLLAVSAKYGRISSGMRNVGNRVY